MNKSKKNKVQFQLLNLIEEETIIYKGALILQKNVMC